MLAEHANRLAAAEWLVTNNALQPTLLLLHITQLLWSEVHKGIISSSITSHVSVYTLSPTKTRVWQYNDDCDTSRHPFTDVRRRILLHIGGLLPSQWNLHAHILNGMFIRISRSTWTMERHLSTQTHATSARINIRRQHRPSYVAPSECEYRRC